MKTLVGFDGGFEKKFMTFVTHGSFHVDFHIVVLVSFKFHMIRWFCGLFVESPIEELTCFSSIIEFVVSAGSSD